MSKNQSVVSALLKRKTELISEISKLEDEVRELNDEISKQLGDKTLDKVYDDETPDHIKGTEDDQKRTINK